MRDWFRRLMMGRYGVDQLTWVLLALSLVISLCGSIFQIKGLSILCWAVLVVCYLLILLPVSLLGSWLERRLRYAEFGD